MSSIIDTADNGVRVIPLTQGYTTIIDADDYDRISQHKWYYHQGYAFRSALIAPDVRKLVGMHRVIMGLDAYDKRVVDHINGDKLDNRRDNLRICTQADNTRNTRKRKDGKSKYKGVCKSGAYWQVGVRIGGKYVYGGSFKDERLAALKYNEMAAEAYGEFAKLNNVS